LKINPRKALYQKLRRLGETFVTSEKEKNVCFCDQLKAAMRKTILEVPVFPYSFVYENIFFIQNIILFNNPRKYS
jgi:hypothetical protein